MLDRRNAGRRVRLEAAGDDDMALPSGAEGTVRYYRWTQTAVGILAVDWDDGSTLSLIEGYDAWTLL
jgi:hypothetical protein